jgi:predicted ATP-binding protein involved in virulence
MKVNSIKVKNYGPLTDINLQFSTEEATRKFPVILVGTNGSGKSLLLANILDALIELKRKHYKDIPEVPTQKLFKLGKQDYVHLKTQYSFVEIEFEHESQKGTYVDFVSRLPKEQLSSFVTENGIKGLDLSAPNLTEHGFYKNVTGNPDFLKCFHEAVLLYFPASRYEKPAWLTPERSLGFDKEERFVGQSDSIIFQTNILETIEGWILDVFLDAELYERQLLPAKSLFAIDPRFAETPLGNLNVLASYQGRNTICKKILNSILTQIFQAKNPDIEYARLGISQKFNRKIAVIVKEKGREEVEIAPSLSHLSSGELMVFSIFANIVKEWDRLGKPDFNDSNQITGIVLIDEVDLHLHISLQKQLLPRLFRLFPKIQFIITTHSPFFLMGMQESDPESSVFSLPLGNRITFEDFTELQEAFKIFVDKFTTFQNSFEKLKTEISKSSKPLIITEGKTDWQHIRNALNNFKAANEYSGLDIDFLEYGDEVTMGDQELMNLIRQFSKVKQPRLIICIFDRDNPRILTAIPDPYKSFGNNVFAFCIPKPAHRMDYANISIEFYFRESDLKLVDGRGRRLLFTNEVEKIIRTSMTPSARAEVQFRLKDSPVAEEELTKKVYDQDVEQVLDAYGRPVGISKSVFASYICDKTPPFNKCDLSEFKKIIEIIQTICSNHNPAQSAST